MKKFAFFRNGLLCCLLVAVTVSATTDAPVKKHPQPPAGKARIQVAILLDVSNSMDGLIEQAKAQLWNMVSVMGRATCNKETPAISIALYEYGRSSNDASQGYIQQLSGFTDNLDQLSETLFSINTLGGEEYCGQVLLRSIDELNWDGQASSYKVVFIAGNEDFLQGKVGWQQACTAAARKGVIVNTIYCGDKMQGVREHWSLAGECGNGSYTNIDQDAKTIDIPTPYDSILFSLNDQLNATYIAFGNSGNKQQLKQEAVDKMNYSMSKSVAAKRVAVKGKRELYNNAGWDLVDAAEKDSLIVTRIDRSTLPDSLKTISKEALNRMVNTKKSQRLNIRKEIDTYSLQREKYITSKKAELYKGKNGTTLEIAIEKIIRQQAAQFNMVIQ